MTVNKVVLVGNLGRDPEIRYTADGTAVANLAIATSESWKDKNTGERREETEWHRVALFGRAAEIAGEYLRKGSQVYIEGRLQTRKWQDKDGQDRYTTEIRGTEMKLLGRRSDNQDGGNQGHGAGDDGFSSPAPAPQPTRQAPPAQSRPAAPQQSRPAQPRPAPAPVQKYDDGFEDDVPF